MNQSSHHGYYADRAASSRMLAQQAVTPAIAAIHADLAARYDVLATRSGRSAVQAT